MASTDTNASSQCGSTSDSAGRASSETIASPHTRCRAAADRRRISAAASAAAASSSVPRATSHTAGASHGAASWAGSGIAIRQWPWLRAVSIRLAMRSSSASDIRLRDSSSSAATAASVEPPKKVRTMWESALRRADSRGTVGRYR